VQLRETESSCKASPLQPRARRTLLRTMSSVSRRISSRLHASSLLALSSPLATKSGVEGSRPARAIASLYSCHSRARPPMMIAQSAASFSMRMWTPLNEGAPPCAAVMPCTTLSASACAAAGVHSQFAPSSHDCPASKQLASESSARPCRCTTACRRE
jgi:hypothetical protein